MPGPEAFGAFARDHIENPRNTGPLPVVAGAVIGSGEAGSRASGSLVRLRVAVHGHVIVAARYELLGEPALVACASYLSECLAGRRAEPAAIPSGLEIARALELPREAHGAGLLAEDAARRALENVPGAGGGD